MEPHQVDFKKFIDKFTESGAREYFEEFTFQYVKLQHGPDNTIKQIRKNPGDWGIDIIMGDMSDNTIVWQCKFFINEISKSQRNNIRESFKTAMNKSRENDYKIFKWILCIPIDFDANELKWWSKWKMKQEKNYDVLIDVLGLSEFKFKCHDKLFENLYNDSFDISPELQPYPPLVDTDVEDLLIYEKHLSLTDIEPKMIAEIKNRYFYAEYFVRNVYQRNSELEISKIDTIIEDIKAVWQSFHYEIYLNRIEDDGKDLYMKIQSHIVHNLEYYRSVYPGIKLLDIIGLLFILTDQNQIFWIKAKPVI